MERGARGLISKTADCRRGEKEGLVRRGYRFGNAFKSSCRVVRRAQILEQVAKHEREDVQSDVRREVFRQEKIGLGLRAQAKSGV